MPPEKSDNTIESRLGASLFRSQNINRISAIEIERIRVNPNQPRKFFDETKLHELAVSLREKGQLQPIIVTVSPNDPDTFLIVAGERRFRASQLNKARTIECVITKGDVDEIALIENLQRDDLKPIEEAEAIKRLMDERGYSQRQVAELLGTTRVAINEIVALTKLPVAIREACRASNLATKSFLLTLTRMETEEQQLQAWAAFTSGTTVMDARAMKAGKATDRHSKFADDILRFAKKVTKLEAPTDEQRDAIAKAKRELDRAVRKLFEGTQNVREETSFDEKTN